MQPVESGLDPREVPSYDMAEAAHYLRMPQSTLRAWFRGQGTFQPVLAAAGSERPVQLSFFNLVEAHVLNALRRDHEISLQRVRFALDTLHGMFPESRHPLIDERFETDGVDLFLRRYSELVNLSRPNQAFMKDVLNEHLRRIVWASDNFPSEFYPFSSPNFADASRRSIAINPRISFGRRVISGTGIPTRIIFERYAAGESIQDLADDYGRPRLEIEDAIRCELEPVAA